MRPDAIDWNSKSDHIGLAFLPRRRLHRVIRRWIILVIAVQGVVSGSLLIGLSSGWWSIAGMQRTPVLAVLAGMVFVAIAVLPFVHWNVRRWSDGLHHLHAAIKRLAGGAVPKPVPVGGDGEVAYLAVAFNDMAGKLLAGRRALILANEDLERRVTMRTAELSVANAELDRKNAALAHLTDTALRFTDDVAHEFRTPLTVILEFASIMTDGLGGPVTEKQTEFLQYITGATTDLASLVDDFLDSSKLRAGGLRVDRRTHSVQQIIESTWPTIESRATENQIVLERRIDDDLPEVFADIDKARRTLVNLAVNAIKFTKAAGQVTIAARRGEHGGVEINITDQGPGLSAPEVAALFQRFKQGGEGERSSFKGFGLGLHIVRDLVDINLGAISIRSVVGQGSTFSFSLPSDDAQTILEWTLERAGERNPLPMMSVLRVDRDDSSFDLNELRTFLTSTTYPRDVQFQAPHERALFVVGETGEPNRWMKRLLLQDEGRRERDERRSIAPLRIEVVGTWPVCDAKEPILSAILADSPTEIFAHA